tara:strand:+ start:1688 stop:1954 length:267 start_codon:yes stop_codon:yes gene_type:complete
MTEKHSYVNPSVKQDLAHLEASVSDDEERDPTTGFAKRKKISDRECIYKCLDNCENLAGLDKTQVQKLMKEFSVEKTDEQIKSEYPPL